MKQLEKRRHFVAVIPLWLASLIDENNLPIKTALNFRELAAITSVEDVCFYWHYLSKIDTYLDGSFNDMECIIHSKHNIAWVNEFANDIEKSRKTFAISFDKHKSELAADNVPPIVRKTPYRPLAVGGDTLLLIAKEGDMSYDREEFYSDCMGELNKQMSPNSSSKFDAFKNYTLS